MIAGIVLDSLTPLARVTIAGSPVLAAVILRVAFGRNGITRWLVTLATMWFAINVLSAPFTAGVRRDMMSVRSIFP